MSNTEEKEVVTPVDYTQNTPEQNIELLGEKDQIISDMQEQTLAYQKEMEGKIAPDKTIITHEGKQFEIKGKLLLIPSHGKLTAQDIAKDPELIALVVTKYPGMLKEIV